MFIVKQGFGDTMPLDTVEGHRATLVRLAACLASDEQVLEIATAGTCHLCEDLPAIRAFRIEKSAGDDLAVQEKGLDMLRVSGPQEYPAPWIKGSHIAPGETGHHHSDQPADLAEHIASGSSSIIIEEHDADPEAFARADADDSDQGGALREAADPACLHLVDRSRAADPLRVPSRP